MAEKAPMSIIALLCIGWAFTILLGYAFLLTILTEGM